MTRARDNLSVDSTLNLTPTQLQQGQKRFKEWHWGVDAVKVLDWNDPDMPDSLIECGRLVRVHIRLPRNGSRHPRTERDTMIQFSKTLSDASYLAFDPDHAHERLYMLVASKARQVLADRLWNGNDSSPMDMAKLAQIAGGRHGREDYPRIRVKPVGVLTAVVYYTNKQGDGLSYYIHQMAELTGGYPILAVDESGRLWICGGSYTAPTPGITD